MRIFRTPGALETKQGVPGLSGVCYRGSHTSGSVPYCSSEIKNENKNFCILSNHAYSVEIKVGIKVSFESKCGKRTRASERWMDDKKIDR